MPKRVLLIAYYFPPIGGSGVQRPAKFVKYLPRYGWQPYVISTDRPFGNGSEGWDESLLEDIPQDVSVWRISTPQPHPVQWLARRIGWKARDIHADSESVEKHRYSSPARSSMAKRVRRALLAPLYWVQEPPIDLAFYWSLRIVPLACHIVEAENIDVILTTVPPWSALLSGCLLKALTKRPWAADFRDPWTDNTFTYFPSPIRRRVDQQLERRFIAHADAIISVTAPLVAQLRGKVTGRNSGKPFVLIPNGWDRDDFPDLSAVRQGLPTPKTSNGALVFLHAGSTYLEEPLPLLRALERLEHQTRAKLLFHFIGYLHPEDRTRIEVSTFADRFRLQSQRVTHPEALRMMREAHVLLLLLRKGPGASSGKIFEYMVSGRPVLAIGRGVAEQIVDECGIGVTVHPEDVPRLANLLYEATQDYEGFVRRYYRPNWDAIERYERSFLTAGLAQTLDAVCRNP
ncbi:MAG: glycosyltransferase family 4 protein [Chloroflexia bacterium]